MEGSTLHSNRGASVDASLGASNFLDGSEHVVRCSHLSGLVMRLVDAFGDWLKPQRARVSPKSRLGEKLAYIARHWDGRQIFLADGCVEMDNNSVENLARPIAVSRKNALFAGHDEGTAARGRIASLIEMAKLSGVEPDAWLKATLEAIAAGHPNQPHRRTATLELQARVSLKAGCRARNAYGAREGRPHRTRVRQERWSGGAARS